MLISLYGGQYNALRRRNDTAGKWRRNQLYGVNELHDNDRVSHILLGEFHGIMIDKMVGLRDQLFSSRSASQVIGVVCAIRTYGSFYQQCVPFFILRYVRTAVVSVLGVLRTNCMYYTMTKKV